MRPPLLEMVLRTPELDRARYPDLHSLKYPFGGTMGTGVRSAGKRSYAGWDLYATPGTTAFAITDGSVVYIGTMMATATYYSSNLCSEAGRCMDFTHI